MKILYFGFAQPRYSIDGVYIKGLRENSVEVIELFYPKKSLSRYKKMLQDYLRNKINVDFIIVGHASPTAVIFLKVFTRRKVIFNALCSEYERMIISRGLAKPFSLKAIYYWVQDFLATHMASLVLLESPQQIEYFIKLFKISPKKCFLARTGVNDDTFNNGHNLDKFETFTALFRGRLLPEAGARYAVEAAKKLEGQGVNILMLASGQEEKKLKVLIEKLHPSNLKLVTEFLSDEDLIKTMQMSHLSLGQLGDHPRLQRTVPHKAYESLAMKLPYLTARNEAVTELLTEGENCLAFNPADSNDLEEKILWAKKNPDKLSEISQKGYELYQQELTSKILAKKLLNRLSN